MEKRWGPMKAQANQNFCPLSVTDYDEWYLDFKETRVSATTPASHRSSRPSQWHHIDHPEPNTYITEIIQSATSASQKSSRLPHLLQ